MNRHALATLMLCCLALMLFNIGGSADQQGTGTGGLGGDDDPLLPAASRTLQGEAASAAPLPEFSGLGAIFAIALAVFAYLFIRKQKVNFSSY